LIFDLGMPPSSIVESVCARPVSRTGRVEDLALTALDDFSSAEATVIARARAALAKHQERSALASRAFGALNVVESALGVHLDRNVGVRRGRTRRR